MKERSVSPVGAIACGVRRVVAPSLCIRENGFGTTRVIRIRIRNQFLLRGSTKLVLLYNIVSHRVRPTFVYSPKSRFPVFISGQYTTILILIIIMARSSALPPRFECFSKRRSFNGERKTAALLFRFDTVELSLL